MASKQFLIDDHITVKIYKRKSSRNLRLSISSTGEIRVSIPLWAPYSSGITFAKSKLDWIKSQKHEPNVLIHNQPIGKAHHLVFIPAITTKVIGRVVDNEIRVTHPDNLDETNNKVQEAASKASVRALRSQAERLLPQRLAELASLHGYNYQSVSVKRLKSRWGSCDQKSNIILNLYLVQLPWELIDYVLIHELVHTKVMRHGPDFWEVMQRELPNLKSLKTQIKKYQPILHGSL